MTEETIITPTIIITGAGLSGMITALAFASKNIKTTILESQSIDDEKFYSDLRTTALTPASRQFLNNINIWAEIETISSKMLDIYVVDNKAPEILHFFKDKEALGYIVKNSEFKKLLASIVKSSPFITIIDQCNYNKVSSYIDHSLLHLNTNDTLKCDLLIICDGYNSKAKQPFFSSIIEKYYNQTALIFNIQHEKDHENCAVEHFMQSGPLATLPLFNQKDSSVVWTVAEKQASLLKSLPIAEFEYILQKNCGNALGKIIINSDIRAFPLKARLTNKYYHNKLVLLADSAHIIHPLAGQGLNLGMKDIKSLVELVNSSDTKQETLQKYQASRKDDNLAMYAITDGLNSIFSNDSKALWYLRRTGLKMINNFKPLKNLLLHYAMGQR